MPVSPYVRRMRDRIGHDLLLLPGVTAVIRDGDRFLLARQRDTERWSLVGGGIEPLEDPTDAVRREVEEELGVTPEVGRIIGAYGGEALASTYPNGDRVSYVTTAFECLLPSRSLQLEVSELIEVEWFTRDEALALPRHDWIDRVLADAERRHRLLTLPVPAYTTTPILDGDTVPTAGIRKSAQNWRRCAGGAAGEGGR